MGKNLTFGQAVEYLKHGRKVKRAGWGGYWFIQEIVVLHDMYPETENMKNMIVACLKDNGGYSPAQPYQADILAEDWEVVE